MCPTEKPCLKRNLVINKYQVILYMTFNTMKVKDLRKLISTYNLKGTSKFTKQKLIDLLTLKFDLIDNRLVAKSTTVAKKRITPQLVQAPTQNIPQELQQSGSSEGQKSFNKSLNKLTSRVKARADNPKVQNMASRIRGKLRTIEPMLNVYKKKSKLPHSGFGLFAMKDIPAEQKIVEYTGTMLSPEQGKNSKSDYLFEIPKTKNVIDGQNMQNWGRWSNDPIDPSKTNAYLKPYANDKAFLYSTKDIKKDEEILITYGHEYWKTYEHMELLYEDDKCKLYDTGDAKFRKWMQVEFNAED